MKVFLLERKKESKTFPFVFWIKRRSNKRGKWVRLKWSKTLKIQPLKIYTLLPVLYFLCEVLPSLSSFWQYFLTITNTAAKSRSLQVQLLFLLAVSLSDDAAFIQNRSPLPSHCSIVLSGKTHSGDFTSPRHFLTQLVDNQDQPLQRLWE